MNAFKQVYDRFERFAVACGYEFERSQIEKIRFFNVEIHFPEIRRTIGAKLDLDVVAEHMPRLAYPASPSDMAIYSSLCKKRIAMYLTELKSTKSMLILGAGLECQLPTGKEIKQTIENFEKDTRLLERYYEHLVIDFVFSDAPPFEDRLIRIADNCNIEIFTENWTRLLGYRQKQQLTHFIFDWEIQIRDEQCNLSCKYQKPMEIAGLVKAMKEAELILIIGVQIIPERVLVSAIEALRENKLPVDVIYFKRSATIKNSSILDGVMNYKNNLGLAVYSGASGMIGGAIELCQGLMT